MLKILWANGNHHILWLWFHNYTVWEEIFPLWISTSFHLVSDFENACLITFCSLYPGLGPSWYLQHVIVWDKQTDNMYFFLVEDWLSVENEKNEGMVEKEVLAACEFRHNGIMNWRWVEMGGKGERDLLEPGMGWVWQQQLHWFMWTWNWS